MADIPVGRYLFERIAQLGVKSVFGVPGDYELALLDFIPPSGLQWRGNPNELIAGYAADGYARVNGVGAVVTTFGPGELSNLCGISGSYTEFVSVVHIVGYPTEAAQNGPNIMHHSLGEVGNGKFDVFHKMSEHVTCASTVLHDSATAVGEIDRVLNAMMHYSQPVYIGLPADIAQKTIPSSHLSTSLITTLPANDATLQTEVVSSIYALITGSSNPIIIVDGGATRNRILTQAFALIKLTECPYFVTAMGKGSVSEHLPTFGGVYGGASSVAEVKAAVETSDLILWLGNYPSDFNTGVFTETLNKDVVVDFQRLFVKIGRERFDVKMKYVLEELISALKEKPIAPKQRGVSWDPYPTDDIKKEAILTQDWLWPTMGKYFKDGDFVIAETGTSSYGIPAASLKHATNVQMYNQTVFGSIGFATGSAVGAFVAGKESGSIKRGILVTGEGSLQLTVQAFSDLFRHEVNPTVFLINNGGYCIERLIHGMDAEYNTVPVWDYAGLFQVFGPAFETRHHLIKTPEELETLLADDIFNEASCPQMVELILGKHDAPGAVIRAAAAVEEFNRRKA
jgi:pyruvate decarboxylase